MDLRPATFASQPPSKPEHVLSQEPLTPDTQNRVFDVQTEGSFESLKNCENAILKRESIATACLKEQNEVTISDIGIVEAFPSIRGSA
ncbi:hypothetical protein U1Q18_004017 [Sarracenia purpurea var. burkii]